MTSAARALARPVTYEDAHARSLSAAAAARTGRNPIEYLSNAFPRSSYVAPHVAACMRVTVWPKALPS